MMAANFRSSILGAITTKDCSGFGNSCMFDVAFTPNHQSLWFTGDAGFVGHKPKPECHFVFRRCPTVKARKNI
jgi:hypothetical protein